MILNLFIFIFLLFFIIDRYAQFMEESYLCLNKGFSSYDNKIKDLSSLLTKSLREIDQYFNNESEFTLKRNLIYTYMDNIEDCVKEYDRFQIEYHRIKKAYIFKCMISDKFKKEFEANKFNKI